jgi:hypothetical protein
MLYFRFSYSYELANWSAKIGKKRKLPTLFSKKYLLVSFFYLQLAQELDFTGLFKVNLLIFGHFL